MEEVFGAAANPKYRLDYDDFQITPEGTKIYRIIALRSFGDAERVEEGQKGGYIEGHHNLSHAGNCWAAGLSKISRQGRLEKNAFICDYVEVTDFALMTDDTYANGRAHIGEWVRMEDESMAGGHARLTGTVLMSKRSRAAGNVFLRERFTITDEAFVHGSFVGAGTMHLGGNSELDSGTWTGRKAEADLGLEAARTV